MTTCPMDIINDLFLRLPATSLVRCRVLSKPCFTLIDDPDFVKSHLNRTLETGDHLMILLRRPGLLRTVELEAPGNVSDIAHPLQAGGLTEVFGSCNGLIGLYNSPNDLALFNPSTRKMHRLPFEPIGFPESSITREFVFYGLGYDSVNDDYKVVRMLQSKIKGGKENFGYPIEIKVFSLKTNSWRRIYLTFEVQILFVYFYYHLLHRRGNGVLASNHLHWILPRGRGAAFNTVVKFDLASEELEVLGFPRDLYLQDNMGIGVLDGSLCLMCYDELSHVDIWVRREYEDAGSWSKMFRVPKPESVQSFDFLRPLIYSKDRSKILLEINNAKNLMWFDLESKGFTTVGIKDFDDSFSAEILVSSLVLGCKGDPTEVQRRKDRTLNKSNKRDGFLSKGFKLKL